MSAEGKQLKEMYESIKSEIPYTPQIGIVLGSGLGNILDSITIDKIIPYTSIAHFPKSTAPDHKGQYLFAYINSVPCVLMQGRVHYYEGYDIKTVVVPQRLMALMGIKTAILTNAAGGMDSTFSVGDIMMITDHISSLIPSPLRGENIDEFGVRFPDMTHVYSKELSDKARTVAKTCQLNLKEGIYVQLPGPQFETPAEINFYKSQGWGACGMSTVVEAIALRHAGVDVLGFSLITNMAAGLSKTLLAGTDVVDVASKRADVFSSFIMSLVGAIKR